MKRHVAKHLNTDQRLIVVMMQIPGREDHALVCAPDSLPPRYEQSVRDLLESAEGQAEADLSRLLSRRIMPDTGRSVLESLHTEGRLMALPVSSILMMPRPNQPFPLEEILRSMGRSTATTPRAPVSPYQDTMPTPPFTMPEENTKFNPHSHNLEAGKANDQEAIARNLLFEASMIEGDAKVLMNDANAKRSRAYSMAPSLRPASPVEMSPMPLVNEAEQVVMDAPAKVARTKREPKVTAPPRQRTKRAL